MNTSSNSDTIAVLGLGPMGRAIARAVADAGGQVRAWNRTPRELEQAPSAGTIKLFDSPGAAVDSAGLVVVCVRDHSASRTVIDQLAGAVGESVVVNASTGTPVEAVESAERAAALGLRYVTAAVMVPTPMVGTEHSFVLYAGRDEDIEVTDRLRAALGGVNDIVGVDHAVPPALDLAMLDVYFAGMYAFLHSAALVGAHGIEATRYLPYAEGIVETLRATLPGLTTALENRTYDDGEARLDMCLAFLDHIVATSTDVGLDPGLARLVRDASSRAMTTWPADTDWDVVAEELLSSVTR